MDWKSVIIVSFAKIFMFVCVCLHQTKTQCVRRYIIVDTQQIDSGCGGGSLLLLFALILTLCQAQRGNMAGRARIHGYGLEMHERLGGAGSWGREAGLAGVPAVPLP